MGSKAFFKGVSGAGLFLMAAAGLAADVVETKSGARLLGTVKKVAEGQVVLETEYAGLLTIKQSEVVRIEVDEPKVVRLKDSTTVTGTVVTQDDGAVAIRGDSGTITTPISDIAVTWQPGETDPAVVALQRRWAYEAAVDISGKSGNSEELSTALSFSATLKGSEDTLKFYTAYDRQETNGTTSSDKFKVGVDYTNQFKPRYSWYARDEGGFDQEKDIDLYNVAGVGLGYDVIKSDKQSLVTRGGLSYRYEVHGNAANDVNSLGLDFALLHTYTFTNAKMNNSLTYVPSFDDFGNYKAVHDSSFEMPLGAGFWKLRIGINNDYTSQPGAGLEHLDTTYYTRLILSWQ